MSYLPADLDDLSLEPNTDFPGSNLQSFDLPRPDVTLCAAACKSDTACRGYTYVRPGVQAAQARCWLKKSVGEVAHNSCCASGRKPLDSGQHTNLVRGKPVTAQASCQQSTTADIFDKICSVIKSVSCQITDESCGSRTRQVYVGSNFYAATPAEIQKWNSYGGRGKLLGEASMCALRELSPKAVLGNGPKLGGPIEVADSGSTLLGNFSVKQQVGLLSFDQAKREFKGYRRLSLCAPVVGCFDSVAQDISVGLGTYKLNPAATAGVGGPKLDQHFVLNVTTETSQKALVLKPTPFPIATPVGPVSVQPEFDYSSRDTVADSPYSGSHQTSRKAGDEPGWLHQALLKDIYGVDYGIAFADLNPNPRAISGWLSPTALGNRDPSETGSVWQPSDTNVRPDGDLSKARSNDEKKSATEISAKAKVSYPTDGKLGSLLPSWVSNSGGDVNLSIFVEPALRTAFSGQFDILPSEGVVQPGDIGAGGAWSASDLRIKTAVGSALDFTVTAGLDLTISFPIVGTVVDVHPRWAPKPIFEKPGYKAGDTSYFASGDGPWPTSEPRRYTVFKTFKTNLLTGNDAAAAYSYVEACLAPNKQLAAETPPAPTATPGDASKLFSPDVIDWPCNVCLAVDGKGTTPLFPATRPPGAKVWKCDYTFKSGCHDMCRFNNNVLTYDYGPDKNMTIGNKTGEVCYIEPPK
ncbi:MAG TPA: PAN domain-containing protein [Candidatus Angelobacter sp.]|nr:PAN domain-containing protein [Candidatus Angelobacter sp.]